MINWTTNITMYNSNSTLYDEFEQLQTNQLKLFKMKNEMYGRYNVMGGDPDPDSNYTDDQIEEALNGLYYRMRDKLSRFKNILDNKFVSIDEPLEDTLNDLSNYSNIAILINNGKWFK